MTDDLRARHHTSAAELRREIEQLRAENARLRALLAARPEAVGGQSASPIPTAMTLFGEDEPLLPKVPARPSSRVPRSRSERSPRSSLWTGSLCSTSGASDCRSISGSAAGGWARLAVDQVA